MSSQGAAPDVRVAYLKQAWRDVTFVHWRYDRSSLQPKMPPGLAVEEYGGAAWLTLVALRTVDARLPGAPPVPLLSNFAQMNLRTYVRGPQNIPGIWLLSVDAGRMLATLGARLLLGAPYYLAGANVARQEDTDAVRYAGWRRSGTTLAGCHLVVRPGETVQSDERDGWLTDRWYAYTAHLGTLLRHPVSHEPWPLRAASLVRLTQSLTTAAGLPQPSGEPLVRYSYGVTDVRMGLPQPAGFLKARD